MALTIDNEGDVLVTGAIPRPEQIAAVSFGPTDLLLDERAAFLARVIPTGEMIWATVAYGASWGSAVLTDSQGDIFVAGRIDQPATFDGVTVTPAGRSELFVWKLAKP